MSVYKDTKTNTWRVCYRYTDWQGNRKQSTKRGFATKREAQAWEREQQNKSEADLDMTFESFVETYTADMKSRMKENTWHTKEHILRTKIMPYFGKRKISEIQPKDVIAWQNAMLDGKDKNGKPYSPVYLKTVHNQLSALFNHAVKFYGLKENPAAKVGNMGKAKAREMLFWTQEEYKKFSFAIMDKPISFYAFEMLYWCGIREGELLALTPEDFDFERGTVTINKSYQRIQKLSYPRNGARRGDSRGKEDQNSRSAPQSHFTPDRDGIFRGGDCRPSGTREHQYHLQLRSSVSVHTDGYGR